MFDSYSAAVFFGAFASATLLPGGSEVLVAAADQHDVAPDWWLFVLATTGNTLGGMTSFALGRVLPPRGQDSAKFAKALGRLQRYGPPALLMSWVPLIGDPLCVVAGWLRFHWLAVLGYMAVGKASRYAALLWLM